jgi:hypothetical protein
MYIYITLKIVFLQNVSEDQNYQKIEAPGFYKSDITNDVHDSTLVS